jgi:hypothetical protein
MAPRLLCEGLKAMAIIELAFGSLPCGVILVR